MFANTSVIDVVKVHFFCTWKNYVNRSKRASWKIYAIFNLMLHTLQTYYGAIIFCNTNLCDCCLTYIISIKLIKLVQKNVALWKYSVLLSYLKFVKCLFSLFPCVKADKCNWLEWRNILYNKLSQISCTLALIAKYLWGLPRLTANQL